MPGEPDFSKLSSPAEQAWKKLDIVMLIILPVLSVVLSLGLKVNYVGALLLFFGLPALWFSIRTPQQIGRVSLFALLFAIPFTLIIDYLAIIDRSWFIPHSLFPERLFGVIPWEDFLWGWLFVYAVVIYYEHFLDKGGMIKFDRRWKYLAWPLTILLLLFVVTIMVKPEWLSIPYAYWWIGCLLVLLPAITFLSFFPRLVSKYVKTGTYFFALTLLYELTALQLGHWEFPGQNFIGWVSIGPWQMPFEEFFFWFVLAAVAILSYYEFFVDDRK